MTDTETVASSVKSTVEEIARREPAIGCIDGRRLR